MEAETDLTKSLEAGMALHSSSELRQEVKSL